MYLCWIQLYIGWIRLYYICAVIAGVRLWKLCAQ